MRHARRAVLPILALLLLTSCAKNVQVQTPATPEQRAVVVLGVVDSANSALASGVIEAEKLGLISWDDAKQVLLYSRGVSVATVRVAEILRPANTATWTQKQILIAAAIGDLAAPVVVSKLLASDNQKVQTIGVAIASINATMATLARGLQ